MTLWDKPTSRPIRLRLWCRRLSPSGAETLARGADLQWIQGSERSGPKRDGDAMIAQIKHYGMTRRDLLAATALGLAAGAPRFARAAAPQGQLSLGVHVSLAPTWFDPAETV